MNGFLVQTRWAIIPWKQVYFTSTTSLFMNLVMLMLRFSSNIDYCGDSDDSEFCNSEENSANPIGCANGTHELIRPILEVIPTRLH